MQNKKIDSLLSRYYQDMVDQHTAPSYDSQLFREIVPVRKNTLKNLAYAFLIALIIFPGFMDLKRPLEEKLTTVFKEIKLEEKIPAGIMNIKKFFMKHYF